MTAFTDYYVIEVEKELGERVPEFKMELVKNLYVQGYHPKRTAEEIFKVFVEDALKEFLKKSWMSNEEWNETLNESVNNMGGWKKIISDIKVGISNGMSFTQQMNLVKLLLFME